MSEPDTLRVRDGEGGRRSGGIVGGRSKKERKEWEEGDGEGWREEGEGGRRKGRREERGKRRGGGGE